MTLYSKIVLVLLFAATSAGCTNATSTATESTADFFATSKPNTLSGEMEWKDINADSASLCGAQINADITFTLERSAEEENVFTGEGTIAYGKITYEDERRCDDCTVSGEDTSFTITGTVNDDDSTIILHPRLDDTDELHEIQESEQCYGDKENSSTQSQQLLYSLQQGGFLNTWEIVLPSNTTISEETFSWDTGERSGKGMLSLKAL